MENMDHVCLLPEYHDIYNVLNILRAVHLLNLDKIYLTVEYMLMYIMCLPHCVVLFDTWRLLSHCLKQFCLEG